MKSPLYKGEFDHWYCLFPESPRWEASCSFLIHSRIICPRARGLQLWRIFPREYGLPTSHTSSL